MGRIFMNSILEFLNFSIIFYRSSFVNWAFFLISSSSWDNRAKIGCKISPSFDMMAFLNAYSFVIEEFLLEDFI